VLNQIYSYVFVLLMLAALSFFGSLFFQNVKEQNELHERRKANLKSFMTFCQEMKKDFDNPNDACYTIKQAYEMME
jgi:hypothetical protein